MSKSVLRFRILERWCNYHFTVGRGAKAQFENVEGVDEGGFGALGRGVKAIVCRVQIISDV